MRNETIDLLEKTMSYLDEAIEDDTLNDVQKSLIQKAHSNIEDVFTD